jgi:hypothetical protein
MSLSEQSRARSATYHLVNSSASPILEWDDWHLDLFKVFADETNLDSELFWENYSQSVSNPPTPACEGKLEHIFPLDITEYPRFTTAERLKFVGLGRQHYISPRDLTVYLNIESLEAAYSAFEDDMRYNLLRVALNQWAYSLGLPGQETLSEEWERAFRKLFAAGAEFEVLCSRRTVESPDVSMPEPQNSGSEAMVELIRQFVGPYAFERWARSTDWADLNKDLVNVQNTLNGVQYLFSRIKYLGIKLDTISPCKRLEFRFDDDYEVPGSCFRANQWIVPHTLSLYYDDGMSTWVGWDSAYEEYCGEFWDLLEHPERTIPGTWID